MRPAVVEPNSPAQMGSTTRRMTPRPFLKWAGGKSQLSHILFKYVPDSFGGYHEPMLGGGALFFSLYRENQLSGKPVFLSDLNTELIDTYRAVRNRRHMLVEILSTHRYNRSHFYAVRALDPKNLSLVERAARMIYLNRSGFNGLYRVNSRGEFNVPFGRHKNPGICDPDNLQAVSAALRKKEIHLACESFENVTERADRGDLVYFDPPYVPLSNTSNFVSYQKSGFDLNSQEKLATIFTLLARRGVRVMLSNSYTQWVRKRYKGFVLVKVPARRCVNSKADRRNPIDELLVLSFKP